MFKKDTGHTVLDKFKSFICPNSKLLISHKNHIWFLRKQSKSTCQHSSFTCPIEYIKFWLTIIVPVFGGFFCNCPEHFFCQAMEYIKSWCNFHQHCICQQEIYCNCPHHFCRNFISSVLAQSIYYWLMGQQPPTSLWQHSKLYFFHHLNIFNIARPDGRPYLLICCRYQ